jgi:DNA polymerase III alpha subunit
MRLLREARTLGCNQLESPAMRSLIRMMQPADPKGLMKALALIRPGAASLGMKERFIRRVRGLELTPALFTAEARRRGEESSLRLGASAVKGLLADTYGVMLYEDDAMVVASAIAGVPLSEGDRFRRRVQKLRTDEERLAVSREFLGLCARAGTPPDLAKDLWVQMAKFNEFSFCRAHAASYGVLAWASAWLAAHHPVAHWVGALNNNQGLYDARVYLEQAKREGTRIFLPCVNRSGVEFTEEGGAIRVGLNRIFGLESREIEVILEARPFRALGDFMARVRVSWPSLRRLILCGAFDGTGVPRPRLLMSAKARGLDVPPVRDFTEEEKVAYELEILGLSARRHVLSYYAGPRELDSRALPGLVGKRVELLGVMATARITETARQELMEFVTFEDEHGLFEGVFFPDAFRRYRSLLGTLGPYVIEGKVESRYDAVALTVERISRYRTSPVACREHARLL